MSAGAAPEWVPGDPLWPSSGSSYRQHLFNFRDDSEMEDRCVCPDAASWPDPGRFALIGSDEIADFIRQTRETTA